MRTVISLSRDRQAGGRDCWIQTPVFVQDYIILHELMHRREANHSKRYWQQVAAVCPDYTKAEAWLKQHRRLLRQTYQCGLRASTTSLCS